jgi:hypothetical protein
LALVFYSGISVAIYMHGVATELHKLVRAARSFDNIVDLDAGNAFIPGNGDTGFRYLETLRKLARAGRDMPE